MRRAADDRDMANNREDGPGGHYSRPMLRRPEATGTITGGLGLLRCRSYDMVIADGNPPDGTGFDLADAAAERGLRVLVMSGYAFSLPAGTPYQYEILLKPLRPQEIIAGERTLAE